MEGERQMIDFTNCEINKFKYYGGKNGGKICVKYNGEDYMLKFPGVKENSLEKAYSNSCISEYISCKIINSLGYNAQETLLGTYKINNNEKIVVACKDFTKGNKVLKQFAELKNSIVESSQNGYGTEISEVLETIEEQKVFDAKELNDYFWDLFIIDALLGNFDRHNGNWGFLINEELEQIELSPIYDCASCLYPQLTDDMIKDIINNKEEMDARVFVFPNSALKENDKKINYYNYISSLENDECNKALLRIFPKIHLDIINNIIDNTPYISDIRKEFYKNIIRLRYEKILKINYEKLIKL